MPATLLSKPFTIFFASVMLLGSTSLLAQNTKKVAGINLEQLEKAGYRIGWVNQSNSSGLQLPTINSNSFYTVDNADFVSKYDLDSGKWRWSTPVGNQTYNIKSVTEIPALNKTYVLSDGGVFIIESISGNYPSPSSDSNLKTFKYFPLQDTANTSATLFNNILIYGSSNGKVVWTDPEIGFTENTYTIGNTIEVPPTLASGTRTSSGVLRNAIITSSNDGTITAIDVNSVRQIWTMKLLNSVKAPVVSGTNNQLNHGEDIPRTSVFIAGTDHYIRSVDLHTGKPRWKVLTAAPLIDSPFIVDEVLYQRIPFIGLSSCQAFPYDITGKQNWVAEDVTGTVITTTNAGKLVSWDKDKRMLQVVDPRKGSIVTTLSLPSAKNLITDSTSNGSLFILTDTDMILRLDPRP